MYVYGWKGLINIFDSGTVMYRCYESESCDYIDAYVVNGLLNILRILKRNGRRIIIHNVFA